MKSAAEQSAALLRGVVDVHTREDLEAKLKRERPLRVKLGFDPSAPDLHLGHTVVLRKLRQFQDFGHQAVIIIGDFTGLVGDPTGRSKTRPQLTPQEVEANAKTYLDQVGRVVDVERAVIERNSKWLKPLSFFELIQLSSKMTVARFLERDDFSTRHKKGVPIGLHEFLYLVMQAYDSVMVRADVELGGTDQTFNLLVARDLMRDHDLDPQVAMTTPILRGLDGTQKMSKSLGNHIGVTEDAFEMYSKIMKLPDELMEEYYTLLTSLAGDDVERMCDAGKTHPKSAKDRLAREVASAYHDREGVDRAAERWDEMFSKRRTPDDIPKLKVKSSNGKIKLVDLLMLTKIPKSKSEARRLAEQGGVELDGERKKDPTEVVEVRDGRLLRVGKKKRYFRIVTGG